MELGSSSGVRPCLLTRHQRKLSMSIQVFICRVANQHFSCRKNQEDKTLLFNMAVIYGLRHIYEFLSRNDDASTIQDTPGQLLRQGLASSCAVNTILNWIVHSRMHRLQPKLMYMLGLTQGLQLMYTVRIVLALNLFVFTKSKLSLHFSCGLKKFMLCQLPNCARNFFKQRKIKSLCKNMELRVRSVAEPLSCLVEREATCFLIQ